MKNPKHRGKRRKWAKPAGKVVVIIGNAVAFAGTTRIEAWAFIESAGQGTAFVECNIPWLKKEGEP